MLLINLINGVYAQVELPTQYKYGSPYGFIRSYAGVDHENEPINLRFTLSHQNIIGDLNIDGTNILFDGSEQNWIDSCHFYASLENYGLLNIEILSDSNLLLIYRPISALPEIKISLTVQSEPGIYPFDMLSYDATKLLIFNTDSTADTTGIQSSHIMLVAPKYLDITTQEKINKALRSIYPNATSNSRYPYDMVRNYDETIIKEYLSMMMSESYASSSAYNQWYSNYHMSLTYNKNDLLGISNSYWAYTGGAHGMYGVSLYLYDMLQERLITLDDIFVEDYQEPLQRIINRQLLLDLNEDSTASMQSLGYWEESIPLTNNFTIEENNMVFYYGPYEIAAYAAGPTIITIPLKSLSPMFRRDSPLKRILDF